LAVALERRSMSSSGIEEAKDRHEAELLALPNVTGVGVGERAGNPVIKVFVTQKLPESALGPNELVPEQLDGYEVDVEESGVLEAQTSEEGTV
jgi:hypothetical protein